uniref:Nucleoside deoxyribosyltransferase n=1 Tax=viral metagenome TaxID=1070528 RepID=A0A6M3JEG7_9ZZZZ
MKIYIASSWKNSHAVEMLTDILRGKGYEIISFVEKAVADEGRTEIKFDFVQWINSPDGHDKFLYDINGTTRSDLVVYIGPAGTDAWAEVGAAFGAGVPVYGLWAKGEPAGLMRKMVRWFFDHRDLVKAINDYRVMLRGEVKG